MQQLTHQIQTKPKKHKIKKSKPYSPIRPVSKQFNNPIYAGLEEDREYLYGSGSGWNSWGVDREERKVIQQDSNKNNGYIRKQEHPVLQISRPHAGFSFNRTEYRNQNIPKLKKQNNQLPQIYQGTKTIVSFEPSQTPTLQDIRYKSQQNPHSTHRHLKNNFKIKILPTRHELSQRNLQLSRQNSQHNSIYSNQKMGRFVYNWGYDQNVDDCLLNYYKISHESLPANGKANGKSNGNGVKQKSTHKQQNILRKNLVKRVLEGRYRNS